MTTYRLNGKEISRSEFLRAFQGMAQWIDAQVREAADDNAPIPMFNTDLGPLVISVDNK